MEEILEEAYDEFCSKASELWNEIIKKYDLDDKIARSIIEDHWHEPECSYQFEKEWKEKTGNLVYEIEKKCDVKFEFDDMFS